MLKEIFDMHDCDKSTKHQYETFYESEFEAIREDPINILEIGIFEGKSVKAWLDYFPNATVYGIDLFQRLTANDVRILEHKRVKWLKGDSTSAAVRSLIKKAWPRIRFDIVIDDGHHIPKSQAATFENIQPLLKKDGRYYIEDVWPLDKLTSEQMNHHWIRSHANQLNILEMQKLLDKIQGFEITRFDNSRLSGHLDSHIIKLQ